MGSQLSTEVQRQFTGESKVLKNDPGIIGYPLKKMVYTRQGGVGGEGYRVMRAQGRFLVMDMFIF